MKIDGKLLAQSALKKKQNLENVKNEGDKTNAMVEATGSGIEEMQYFAECLHKGDHENAHGYLTNIVKKLMKDDTKKEGSGEY